MSAESQPERKDIHLLSEEIRLRREELERRHFLPVDLGLSDAEKDALGKVNIEKNLEQFDYYGPVAQDLENKLEQYFSQMGQGNTEEDIAAIAGKVIRLAKEVTDGLGKEDAWVMVRVSLPDDAFETPRWHPDGSYFSSQEKVYKFVATLKGQQTLFGEKTDVQRYGALERKYYQIFVQAGDDREAMARADADMRNEMLGVIRPIKAAKEGEGVVYLVGHDDAVIHSEPHITEPRIFLAVLPGSKAQIEEWRRRGA